jgi:hypothetical protein
MRLYRIFLLTIACLSLSAARTSAATLMVDNPQDSAPAPTSSSRAITSAATLTVDNTSDNASLTACTSAANDCSLRGAIAAAASGDTITFDPALFLTPRTIRLTSGTGLTINKNLTITGVGGVIIDGNRTDRVFFIQVSGGTVNLSGMTITGGKTAGPGGGIAIAAGTVTLTNVVVTGNVSSAVGPLGGGGIYSVGTLNVVNSIISDNAATGNTSNGGGILSQSTLSVTGSIIAGNTAASSGGGIVALSSSGSSTIINSAIVQNAALTGAGIVCTCSITNSTISGNSGTGVEALSASSIITLTNVTIINNSGGVNTGGSSSVNIRNSLIAGNGADVSSGGSTCQVVSQGNNLVQDRGSCTGWIASDLPNGTNPMIAPLANNGGLTLTHALLPGSPAINAGNNAFATGTTDQRGTGFARIVGAAVDIGAFEAQAPTAAEVSVSGRVTTAEEEGISKAKVFMTNTEGKEWFARTDSSGRYRIDGVPAGETYVFDVRHKRFSFLPQVLTITGDISDLNFTAQPKK